MTKRTSHETGLLGELCAALILMCKGYRILARRYKTPAGEVDLVARRGRALVFVEVKARRDLSTALECVTPAMRGRIERAARLYIAHNPAVAACEMRFDLLALAPPLRWRHLDNAWQPSA
jgi:putative endonuclease